MEVFVELRRALDGLPAGSVIPMSRDEAIARHRTGQVRILGEVTSSVSEEE